MGTINTFETIENLDTNGRIKLLFNNLRDAFLATSKIYDALTDALGIGVHISFIDNIQNSILDLVQELYNGDSTEANGWNSFDDFMNDFCSYIKTNGELYTKYENDLILKNLTTRKVVRSVYYMNKECMQFTFKFKDNLGISIIKSNKIIDALKSYFALKLMFIPKDQHKNFDTTLELQRAELVDEEYYRIHKDVFLEL